MSTRMDIEHHTDLIAQVVDSCIARKQPPDDGQTETLVTAGIALITQIFVDVNRIANALELMAQDINGFETVATENGVEKRRKNDLHESGTGVQPTA